MPRYLLFVLSFIFCFPTQAQACKGHMGSIKSGELSKEIKQLDRALQCLRGKEYPDDIEVCGVQGFGTHSEMEALESCLASRPPSKIFSLAQGTSGRKSYKMALTIECDKKTVLVVFKRERNELIVDGINYLTE